MRRWLAVGIVAVVVLFGGSLAVIEWLDGQGPRSPPRRVEPVEVPPAPQASPLVETPRAFAPPPEPAPPPPPVRAAVPALQPVQEEASPEPERRGVLDVSTSLATLQQRIRSRCGTIQFQEGAEPVGYLLDIEPMDGQVRVAGATVTTSSIGITPSQQICIRRALVYQVLPAPSARPGQGFQVRFVLEGG